MFEHKNEEKMSWDLKKKEMKQSFQPETEMDEAIHCLNPSSIHLMPWLMLP